MKNMDDRTVAGLGFEWSTYDQSCLSETELQAHFDSYFSIFPWQHLPPAAEGFDLGCGTGRWAQKVAPRVGRLHCIDASPEALAVARANLSQVSNCELHCAGVDSMTLTSDSMDFGYALGVLHHVPNPQAALRVCVKKLKKDAPFLLYLYYAFDNQPPWYQALWRASDVGRRMVCRLPAKLKLITTVTTAACVYWPLARAARVAEAAGLSVKSFPLSAYRHASFYTMKTDALDRFGTSLEHRFTRSQIAAMMTDAGLSQLRFSDTAPYWCAVGVRQW